MDIQITGHHPVVDLVDVVETIMSSEPQTVVEDISDLSPPDVVEDAKINLVIS